MAEPLSIMAAAASLFAASLKLSKGLIDLRSQFQKVPVTISGLSNEIQLTSLGLGELESLLRSRQDVLDTGLKDNRVRRNMLKCIEAVTVSMAKSFSLLDAELGKLARDGKESKGISWRLRFMWVESDLDGIMAQVRDQRSSLSFLMQLVSTAKIDDIHRHFQSASPGLAALKRTATGPKDKQRAFVKLQEATPRTESVAPDLQEILEKDIKFPDLGDIDESATPKPATPNPASSGSPPPTTATSQSEPPHRPFHPPAAPSSFPATPYSQSTKAPPSLVHHELHYAVSNNGIDLIPPLLDDKAYSPIALPLDPYNTLPNASKTPLALACYLGYDEILHIFLFRYAWAVNECIGRDLPPLHAAAYAGHLSTVRLLLGYKANPRLRGPGNNTPLFWACSRGHLDIVLLLLSSGAEEDVNFSNDKGLTPLIVAAYHGHASIIPILLTAGADINAANLKSQTALHLASHAGHLKAVTILLSAGAGLNAPTANGKTPLIFAAAAGNVDTVEHLAVSGALINLSDSDGKTALYHASAAGYGPTVEVLLDRLAFTETVTKTGDRPLHTACEKGHARVVGYLLSAGARMDVPRPRDGLDALAVAVWYRRKEVLGPLVLYRVERDSGAYSLQQGLWNALEWGLGEAVDALIESGADVNSVEGNGEAEEEGGSMQSLLSRAVREGKAEAVRLLIEKGADVNKADRFGATPLHRAARGQDVGIAKVLIEAGAKMDLVNKNGKTPVDVADVFGGQAIREFFKERKARG